MDDALTQRVTREIKGLHEFFVDWFTGRTPNTASEFAERFEARFCPDFLIIQPAGEVGTLAGLTGAIRQNYGCSPGFAIAIRRVNVRWRHGDVVLATYEEWQRNARKSNPPDNGRTATVVFVDRGDCLQWLHVHETWLPPQVMAAGPFDF